MIDTHCHLDQEDYDKDRSQKIKKWKEEIDAVITSCAHPRDYDLTIQLVNNYKDFVFASASIHPKYIQELGENQIKKYIEKIESAKNSFIAVGETGLDYNWVKESNWQIKQKELFKKFIVLSQKLNLPLVIHSRDATEEVLEILEKADNDLTLGIFNSMEKAALFKILTGEKESGKNSSLDFNKEDVDKVKKLLNYISQLDIIEGN